jgi:hypothetical protein
MSCDSTPQFFQSGRHFPRIRGRQFLSSSVDPGLRSGPTGPPHIALVEAPRFRAPYLTPDPPPAPLTSSSNTTTVRRRSTTAASGNSREGGDGDAPDDHDGSSYRLANFPAKGASRVVSATVLAPGAGDAGAHAVHLTPCSVMTLFLSWSDRENYRLKTHRLSSGSRRMTSYAERGRVALRLG